MRPDIAVYALTRSTAAKALAKCLNALLQPRTVCNLLCDKTRPNWLAGHCHPRAVILLAEPSDAKKFRLLAFALAHADPVSRHVFVHGLSSNLIDANLHFDVPPLRLTHVLAWHTQEEAPAPMTLTQHAHAAVLALQLNWHSLRYWLYEYACDRPNPQATHFKQFLIALREAHAVRHLLGKPAEELMTVSATRWHEGRDEHGNILTWDQWTARHRLFLDSLREMDCLLSQGQGDAS